MTASTAQPSSRPKTARTAPEVTSGLLAPMRPGVRGRAWEGPLTIKPWDYACTAVIPVLETPEPLEVCLDLLRAQTSRPYMIVIDTGSIEHRDRIASLQAEDCEVHFLRSHGWRHPSEPVAVAQQLGMELCRTDFAFFTHSDAFLMRRTLLAEWIEKARHYKAVGYQISPREYDGWQTELGHTALMLHMPTMRRFGVNWNIDQFCRDLDRDLAVNVIAPNKPDTESNFNATLFRAGIRPLMLGREHNMQRNTTRDFDHPRSFCCSKLYSPDYHAKIAIEMDEAIREARQRLRDWSTQGDH